MSKNWSFQFDPAQQSALPVAIRMAARCQTLRGGMTGDLSQEGWVLDYPITEVGYCRVAGGPEWLERSPGWAHLYPPHTVYQEDYRKAQNYASAYVIFDGAEALGLDRLTRNSRGFARIFDPTGEIGERLAALAFVGFQRGNQGLLEALALLFGIADRLVHFTGRDATDDFVYRLEARPRPPDGDAEKLATAVRHYLELNFREPVTLEAVARALHIGKSTLSHRYRALTGESVFATLLAIRIEQSLLRLRSGERLKIVAREAGFTDEFYYSRIFRRQMGCSPSEWRRTRN